MTKEIARGVPEISSLANFGTCHEAKMLVLFSYAFLVPTGRVTLADDCDAAYAAGDLTRADVPLARTRTHCTAVSCPWQRGT